MMKSKKWYNNLGLAMRAGKLTAGDSNVLDAIRTGEAKLILIASDASDNAQKKYTDKCSYYQIPFLICGTREEIGAAIGKEERVVLAVTDAGFAGLLSKE
nr:ribosomal L7Ae/L30e/S12e/Gadd45 family protein [Gorillibacterium massiliense]